MFVNFRSEPELKTPARLTTLSSQAATCLPQNIVTNKEQMKCTIRKNIRTTPAYTRKWLVFDKLSAPYYNLNQFAVDTSHNILLAIFKQQQKNALYCGLPIQSFV